MNKKFLLFAAVFILLRVLLFGVNISEWGDSYRIVSAAESLRSDFSYPVDEKRLPFFSALIALNPLPVEMMVWAKILQIFFTAGILLLTFRLAKRLFPDLSNFEIWILEFGLLLNPVFLYWSIRVVGGVLLTLLVLLAFNIYYSEFNQTAKLSLLGVVVGLAALTRYEGFLLAGAFALVFLLFRKIKSFTLYSLAFALVISPWFVRNLFVFGNPFFSTYFSEPTTYTYDLRTLLVFLASLVFLFGFPPAFYFFAIKPPTPVGGCRARIFRRSRKARGGKGGSQRLLSAEPHFFARGLSSFLRGFRRGGRLSPLVIFIFLELVLVLLWPAAVPRLFLPLIPLFLIFLMEGLSKVRSEQKGTLFVVSLLMAFLYLASQYVLRLHFLVLSKSVLALVVVLSLLSSFSWLFFDLERARRGFLALFLASQIASSFVVVNNHRRIYSDALYAAQFASSLGGLVGYSDETGVVEYYLGERGRPLPNDLFESRQQWRWLQENQINFIVATDEYEQNSRFKVFADPLFKKKFRLLMSWEVNAAEFFDSWLMARRILPYHEYPVKRSFVYEVLR